MKQKFNLNTKSIIVTVLIYTAIRVLSISVFNNKDFAQFTPLLAMCLFTGSIFKNTTQAILITIGTMLFSDLLIQNVYYSGQHGFLYSGWYWMYLLYVGMMFIGKLGIKKITVLNVLNSTLLSAILYFVISNFIVWIGDGSDARTNFLTKLPFTYDGLKQCYIQALPYFRNSLYGTLLYSGLMFGAYQLISLYALNKNTTVAK